MVTLTIITLTMIALTIITRYNTNYDHNFQVITLAMILLIKLLHLTVITLIQ
jgi:hypothetical protein